MWTFKKLTLFTKQNLELKELHQRNLYILTVFVLFLTSKKFMLYTPRLCCRLCTSLPATNEFLGNNKQEREFKASFYSYILSHIFFSLSFLPASGHLFNLMDWFLFQVTLLFDLFLIEKMMSFLFSLGCIAAFLTIK